MLNERGIKAVTPSALNTPSGQNFSPTTTPCNSPDGSPVRSLSPEPSQSFANMLSSGADMFRKKFIGYDSDIPLTPQRPSRVSSAKNKVALSHLERKALRSIRILEKVEHLGLENILQNSPNAGISPLALHSSNIYTARRTASPMAQLTSFKHLSDNRKKTNDMGSEAFRAAINKGLSNESLSSISTTSSAMNSCASSDISSTSNDNQGPSNSGENSRKSLSENRIKQMQRQRSRRNLINGNSGGQRPDLGTVGGSVRPVRPDLGKTNRKNGPEEKKPEEKSFSQGFVGSISSLLFGRKGGLL